MKIRKIMILTLVVCSLFLTLPNSVSAADETRTITDDEDDVIDMSEEFSDDYPNIDITTIGYSREGISVTLTLTVKGIIEDLGDFENLYENDMVLYIFTLATSHDYYEIMYINQYCLLYSSYREENITDFSVSGSVLEINFDLNNTNETYDSLTVDSMLMTILAGEFGMDTAGDEPLQVAANIPGLGISSNGYYLATEDASIEFKGIAIYGQSPYEYYWEFGDGETSTEQNPNHTYVDAGTYEFNFTVTDGAGASESFTEMIEVVASEDDTKKEPGFELIIAIAAIGLILLWKRR